VILRHIASDGIARCSVVSALIVLIFFGAA
jgi:hypothetical protein